MVIVFFNDTNNIIQKESIKKPRCRYNKNYSEFDVIKIIYLLKRFKILKLTGNLMNYCNNFNGII